MKHSISIILLVFTAHFSTLIAQNALNLLSTWSDSTLVGSSAYDNTYNEVWGIAVNDSEFAIIGSTAGTHFINVTNPSSISEAFFVAGGTAGAQIIHRDYHDNQGFLYAVADEGSNSTLQIIDIRDLPNSINVVYDSKELIRRSHNIFIDSSSNVMYSCISAGTTLPYARLRTFDITDPTNPVVMHDYASIGGYSFQQVHDAYVIRDTAYLNCGPSGMAAINFKDPANPELLYALLPQDYPQPGYNHSGWLSPDGNTYVMADENHGHDMKVYDVTDKREFQFIGLLNAGSSNPYSIPHNQIIHGKYLYSSYYYDGLQVYNMEDPLNITREYYFQTSSINHSQSYEGAWGVYPFLPSGNVLVSDMQNGLFVLSGPETISGNKNEVYQDYQVVLNPNPNAGVFTLSIENDAPIKNASFTLFDLNGKKIYSCPVKTKNNQIELSDIKSGSYYYVLNESTYRKTGKLVVIR